MGTNWGTGSSVWTWGRTSSLWGWRSTGPGCPEGLWSLLLWRYSRPTWTRSCAAGCRWPCFSRRVGLDDPQRSLPTPTILWFCDSVTWAKIQGVYRSLSPRVHNIHQNTRLAVLRTSDVKSKQPQYFPNLFFLPPPAADTWPGVLPRIHRLLSLLHRWAGTSQSVTPCDTLQLLVLWDQSNKWFQHCISAGPTFRGALTSSSSFPKACTLGYCPKWAEKQNVLLVAVPLGTWQQIMSLSTQRHASATQRYVFVWEKFWTTELVRAWWAFQQRKINKCRERLPEDSSEGSSYGNGRLVSASLAPCILTQGKLLLDCYHSILLNRLRKMNQSFVLTLQRS